MKRLALLGMTFLIAAAVAAVIWRSLERRQEASNAIVGSGVVEVDEVNVAPEISGRLVQLLVDEGDNVRAGQVIAKLDSESLEAAAMQAWATLQEAQARLRVLESGSREEQIRAARAALAQAEANVRGTRKAMEIAQIELQKSTELKQQVDAAEAALKAALAAEEAAKERLNLLLSGAREEEKRLAEIAVAQAQASVEGARKALAIAEQDYAEVMVLKRQLDEAEAGHKAAQATLRQAEAALAQANAVYENAKKTAERMEYLWKEGAVSRQQFDDARTAAESAQAQRDAAASALEVARAKAEGALNTLTNLRKLYKDRLEALTRLEEAKTRLNVALEQLRQAEAQRDLVFAGPRKEEIRQAEAMLMEARARVAGAKSALSNARTAYQDRLAAKQQVILAQMQYEMALAQRDAAKAQLDLLLAGERKEVIDAARAEVERARAAWQQAEVSLRKTVIHAPSNGTVSEVVAEVGEVISAGVPIVRILDLERPWVKVYIPVVYLDQVKVGQMATVIIDSATEPNRKFHGKVVEISQEPEFTPKDVQTKEQRVQLVFWAKVAVTDAKGKLKPGMPADVIIETNGGGQNR